VSRFNHDGGHARFPMRMPIRWRWSILVGLSVTCTVVLLFFVMMHIERDAWLQSQAAQAAMQVDHLTDELKLPLLSGSSAEVDVVLHSFLDKVPTAIGVVMRTADGHHQQIGALSVDDRVVAALSQGGDHVRRLPLADLWYAKQIRYANTPLGVVAVRFSERAWEQIAGRLLRQMVLAAVVVVLASGLLVYWIAGRMSQPIEMLSEAAEQVAAGDYRVQLPLRGNDEISDAVAQFNRMVRELAHKAEMRDAFGRYLNPELVERVFDHGDVALNSRRQQVTVLFADMVGFTAFSAANDTERVVDLLNHYFELFHRVIAYYGGHVDKYIGDAVMAIFSMPDDEGDHLRRATMCGLAMAELCAAAAEPAQFRFGLHCGEVILGNIGAAQRLEYTVIGDAVNVASRMIGLGSGGQLVMPRETYSLLGDGFRFEPIAGCRVKGVTHDLEAGCVQVCCADMRKDIARAVAFAEGAAEELRSGRRI